MTQLEPYGRPEAKKRYATILSLSTTWLWTAKEFTISRTLSRCFSYEPCPLVRCCRPQPLQ